MNSVNEIPFAELEAIFFDLDGTLLDSDDQIVDEVSQQLQPFMGAARAKRMARWLIMRIETPGNNAITLLDRLGVERPVMKVASAVLRRGQKHQEAKPHLLVAGVLALVLALNGRYKLGVVTTRSQHHIEALWQQYPELAAVFDVVVGADDTQYLKPSAEPVLLAARKLGVPADRCLMVGDTTVDMWSAKRAGAWRVGVLCGFGERKELERAGANLILESTADLHNLL